MCASGDKLDCTVGQRVEYQGFHGTVRYTGEVAGQTGVWIGVEWDDPSRGKHDGSHNGVQYFRTSHPTAGSLIRCGKLNFGISCVEAIQRRYGKVDGSTAGVDEDAVLELKREFNAPFIELVGFDKVNMKQSQFENLQVVSLRSETVKCCGDPGQLSLLCPSIVELNISNTLINSWKDVAEITSQLPKLAVLDVSDNRISVPTEEEAQSFKEAFKTVRHIIMSNLEYTWEDVLHCAEMWPSLSTLTLHANKVCKLKSPRVGLLASLTSLFLEMNPVNDWENVNKLGNLTNLQVLNLSETGLRKIFFPGVGVSSIFCSLIELNLQGNEIDDWCSINELNKLTSLEILQFQSNPIMKKPHAFEFIIARVKKLKKLNGTEITPQERKGAEYDYMKCHGQEWLAAQDDSTLLQEFEYLHPCYSELIRKHGSFTEDELASSKLAPLKSRMINIRIFCSSQPNMPQFQKKLPKNMTVQKLIGLVQRLMDTGGHVPKLCAISAKAPDVKIALDRDMQELSFYSVEDGDSIDASW